jgi:antitoxin VapB
MRKAKVFMSGNFQAVRLPHDFHFSGNEIMIEKKDGKVILCEKPKNLAYAFHLLTKMPDDFFSDGR